jgi:hypothetical protein
MLIEAFKQVPDFRDRKGQTYRLWSLLALVLAGFLCGRRGLRAVYRMGRASLGWTDRICSQCPRASDGRGPCGLVQLSAAVCDRGGRRLDDVASPLACERCALTDTSAAPWQAALRQCPGWRDRHACTRATFTGPRK